MLTLALDQTITHKKHTGTSPHTHSLSLYPTKTIHITRSHDDPRGHHTTSQRRAIILGVG